MGPVTHRPKGQNLGVRILAAVGFLLFTVGCGKAQTPVLVPTSPTEAGTISTTTVPGDSSQANPDPIPTPPTVTDLSKRNYSGADLSGEDLRGAYLSEINLTRADLSGAQLGEATLDFSKLVGADLSGADLSASWIRVADLSGAGTH